MDESRLHHSETHSYSESFSRVGSTASSSKAPAGRGFLSVMLKLLLLVVVAGSLYYAYQNLDASQIDYVKGLLDSVIIPLQSAVDHTATILGIGSGDATENTGK